MPFEKRTNTYLDIPLVEYLKTNKKTLFGTIMSLPGQAIGAVVSLFKDKGTCRVSKLFSKDIVNQLNAVFERMENPLILKLFLYEKATHTVHYPFAATGTRLGNGEPIYKREQGVTATFQL